MREDFDLAANVMNKHDYCKKYLQFLAFSTKQVFRKLHISWQAWLLLFNLRSNLFYTGSTEKRGEFYVIHTAGPCFCTLQKKLV